MNTTAKDLLLDRGVDLDAMAELVFELQRPYLPQLTHADCRRNLEKVLEKRDVQYAVITGITLDMMAERGTLDEPLGSIVREDGLLYAVDEVLGLCIVNIYGSIGLSNYGYLGEEKPDVVRKLSRHSRVTTFLDDLVAAIVAATCARIAHNAEEAG